LALISTASVTVSNFIGPTASGSSSTTSFIVARKSFNRVFNVDV
jgi:hypothetical protein